MERLFEENLNPLINVVRSMLLEKISQMHVVLSVGDMLTFPNACSPALVQVLQVSETVEGDCSLW